MFTANKVHMQSLPYELLQLISNNLLPRYQCRFAIASSWCYKYLYNDLLRWHVRKDTIPIPKYKILPCGNQSLLEFGTSLILYEDYYGSFCITILSKFWIKYLYENGYYKQLGIPENSAIILFKSNKPIFSKFLKNIHKCYLILLYKSLISFTLMDWRITDNIRSYLCDEDFENFADVLAEDLYIDIWQI